MAAQSLPPASEGWGKVIFTVCLSVHTRGEGTPICWLGGGTPSGPTGGTPSFPTGTSWQGVPWALDGVPPPHGDWMGYPSFETGWGYPLPIGTGWGTLPPPCRQIRRQSNYLAGGMPLVFTQEDFLVRVVKPKTKKGEDELLFICSYVAEKPGGCWEN